MKKKQLIAITLLFWLSLGYYHFLYTPVVLKRELKTIFKTLQQVVDTRDRAQISQSLEGLIADESPPKLEVRFFTLIEQPGVRPMVQEFDSKQSFISFIDNVLYPLDDFGLYNVELGKLDFADGYKSAAVSFTTKQWGDGLSYYAGTGVRMRYSADADCTANVTFKPTPRLSAVNCAIVMRTLPRPEEAGKMRDPAALQQSLKP